MAMIDVTAGGAGEQADKVMERMSDMFGPGHVDQMVRNAIQTCWMALPKERRTMADLEKEIHRLMDRALNDFKIDAAAFGKAI